MRDDLIQEIESIKLECGELSLAIVCGEFEKQKIPVIHWEAPSSSDFKAYLGLAKTLGSCVVVLEQFQFDEAVVESLRPGQAEDIGDDKFSGAQEDQPAFDVEGE